MVDPRATASPFGCATTSDARLEVRALLAGESPSTRSRPSGTASSISCRARRSAQPSSPADAPDLSCVTLHRIAADRRSTRRSSSRNSPSHTPMRSPIAASSLPPLWSRYDGFAAAAEPSAGSEERSAISAFWRATLVDAPGAPRAADHGADGRACALPRLLTRTLDPALVAALARPFAAARSRSLRRPGAGAFCRSVIPLHRRSRHRARGADRAIARASDSNRSSAYSPKPFRSAPALPPTLRSSHISHVRVGDAVAGGASASSRRLRPCSRRPATAARHEARSVRKRRLLRSTRRTPSPVHRLPVAPADEATAPFDLRPEVETSPTTLHVFR